MKKSLYKLIMIGLMLDLTSFAVQAEQSNDFVSGYELNVGALFLRSTGTNFDYAILTNPFPLPTPNWHIQTINPEYAAGFNIGARYIASTDSDAQLNWSHLRTHQAESVSADSSQFIGAFFEVGPNAGTIRQAHGQVKTDYDAVNLDMGHYIQWGSHVETRLFGGLTGVHLKQEWLSTLQDNVPTFTVASDNTSKFTGIGPRVGVNTRFDVNPCFAIVGQMAGSVLVGTAQAEMTFTESSVILLEQDIIVNHQAITSDNATQVVPALDAKLGLNYLFNLVGTIWTVEAGYQAATYINALASYQPNSVVTLIQTGTVPVATMGKTVSSFSNHGPYVNFTVKL